MAKSKPSKPVSRRKLASNLKALSPKKHSKIMAFMPILEEIVALNGGPRTNER